LIPPLIRNTGVIDFKEFAFALSVTSRGRMDERLACTNNLQQTFCVYFHIRLNPIYYLGAFKLYDIDNDGHIGKDEMLEIVESIYAMVGALVKLPPDEDSPEKVHQKYLLPLKLKVKIWLNGGL
jgi:neuronal calcium sensor 1